MNKRNSNKIIALATILLAKANKDNGLTVAQMVEETGIPRASLHRILSEPGFGKCVESRYPPEYYFDPVFQLPEAEPTEEKKEAVGRDFNKAALELPIDETMPHMVQATERLKGYTDTALQEITNTINNVRLFRKGEAKLDTDNLKQLRTALDDAQYRLESYYQFLDKYNVDFDDPTWWEKF